MELCMGCMRPKQSHPVCEHCGYDERQQNQNHQLPVGTVLQGQYRVGRVLGQGGFGITYLGWDQILDIPVAIKEFYPSGFVTRDTTYSTEVSGCEGNRQMYFDNSRARFLREAKALAKFSDIPEIVHVRSFFETNNTAYIIMEYVQGMDLRRYVAQRGGRLGAQETLQLLKPVMAALDTVHEAELVHRDISPDNIMILPNGRVKLLDFGAVRDVENADAERELARSTEAILKHGFAPIEQYQKRGSLGPWTDVYALCGTAYYCMTGKVPPDAPERMTEDVHPDWQNIPGLTPQQKNALEKGMAMRAKDRTKSVRELYAALYAPVQAQMEPDDYPVTAPVQREDPRRAPQPVRIAPVPEAKPAPDTRDRDNKEPAKKKGMGAFIAVAAAILALCAGLLMIPKGNTADNGNSGQQQSQSVPAVDFSSVTQETLAPQNVEPQDVTLSVWVPNSDSEWLEQVMARFEEAHPEYNLKWAYDYCQEGSVLDNAYANPDAVADVFLFANDQLGSLIEMGLLAKLGGSYLEQVQTDFSDTYCDTVTASDGGIYGFPMTANTWFMYYNKSKLSQEDIKSLEACLAKGKVAFPMANSWYTGSFFFANGCTLFGETGADASAGVQFGGTRGEQAVDAMLRLVYDPNFLLDIDGAGVEAMMDGTAVAMFSGSWDYPMLYGALGDDLGAAVLPTMMIGGEAKQLMAFAGAKAVGVNPNSAYAKAAMELAAFMASSESQLLRFELQGVTPACTQLRNDPAVASSMIAAAESAVMDYASVAQPSISAMVYYWDPMTRFGAEVASGAIHSGNAKAKLEEMIRQISAY